MRIPDSTFLLAITIKSKNLSRSVITNVYDSSFNRLSMTKNIIGDTEQTQTHICLPDQIILEIDSEDNELSLVTFAGIRIRKNKLAEIVSYYSGKITDPSMEKIRNLPAKKTLLWSDPGYAILNFFHPDPFAWHL